MMSEGEEEDSLIDELLDGEDDDDILPGNKHVVINSCHLCGLLVLTMHV